MWLINYRPDLCSDPKCLGTNKGMLTLMLPFDGIISVIMTQMIAKLWILRDV